MEDFDKYLDRLVENFFDTGKLVLNETIDTINWDKIGKVIRDPNKSEQIYELLIDMFPNAKEVIDYNYYGDNEEPSPNDTFAEMKSFLWNIDKNTIKGPDLRLSTGFEIDGEYKKDLEKKYDDYVGGKIDKYFRDSSNDPRDTTKEGFKNLPPILVMGKKVIDGNHRTFLAQKVGAELPTFEMVEEPNTHPNAQKILSIIHPNDSDEDGIPNRLDISQEPNLNEHDSILDRIVEEFFDTGKIKIVEDIEKNRKRVQKTTKGKEREELKNSIDKHKGNRELVMKDFGAVSTSWFIRNVNRHGLRDYYDSKKVGWELEKFKEELKNIIDKYKGNRQEILKYYGINTRTLMEWLYKTNLREYFRCFKGNEKMPSNFTKEDIKNAIDEYEGNLQKMMVELCLSKRQLIKYFKNYDLTGYYNGYNYDNKYENSFLNLGFKKPKDKGLESRIHNLRDKGYSFVDNIKNEEVTAEEISDFILSNIIEYMESVDDIVKYDLLSDKDIKDFNGNIIIPKDSKIESKDINQNDSYYSEFLASPVKKSEYGILDDESYLNKYNEVIGVIYKELNKKGNKITDKIKQLLTNDLEGMILSNNIYVPNKGNNIEFYLSNIGQSSPEKQLRISVRYNINLNNRKNFYRIGDGIWGITEGEKSEKGVLYPLSDKPLLTYGERKIYSEDDNMVDRIVEEFFDTGNFDI